MHKEKQRQTNNDLTRIRSLVSDRGFGTGPKKYLEARAILKANIETPSRVENLYGTILSDELAAKSINIFRISLLAYIDIFLASRPVSEKLQNRINYISSSGGALFDNGKPGSLSTAILPYQMVLPFSLIYGTSNQYFSENEYSSSLSAADRSLYRFFSKIGQGPISENTHSWIAPLVRSTREIYDNVLHHAFFSTRAPEKYRSSEAYKINQSKFWFFSFRRFVYSDNSQYFKTLIGVEKWLLHLGKIKYLIAVNVTDDGPGMLNYFKLCTGELSNVDHVGEIIQKKVSSTGLNGAGYGMSNAITALRNNKGLFQVKSGVQVYSTYFDGVQNQMVEEKGDDGPCLAGTTVDMIIPVFAK